MGKGALASSATLKHSFFEVRGWDGKGSFSKLRLNRGGTR